MKGVAGSHLMSFSGKPLWFVKSCIASDDFDRVVQ
jgi:hypothetical protein